MRNILPGLCLILFVTMSHLGVAQVTAPKFGKGLQINAADSSFYMKIGLRFQTLYLSEWDVNDDELSSLTNSESSLFIRRSRLKFDGWAVNPKLKYKCELSLSNRDNGGGNSSTFSNAANIILDASINYNFYKGFSVWLGQGKWPGNRERIVSSGNLQFVDRSRLNSRFTLDRDVGIMLIHQHTLSDNFLVKETLAIGSGEGKNITSGNIGGHAYTAKIEMWPFGSFQSKGDYVGSAVKRESTPKLALAIAYDWNNRAGRTRGQKGSFLTTDANQVIGKNLESVFVDLMFKYQGWSVMMEYTNRKTDDDNPNVFDGESILGTYYTGNATNIAVGYMTMNNWEIAARYTDVNPQEGVANKEDQYTIGISKFIVGHKLKVQTDLTYIAKDASDDNLMYRMQMDIHF